MFTKEIYRQYFLEIHHKQRDMIIMLHHGLDSISDDRMQKALAWHMKREIRLAVLIQKIVRSLSSGPVVKEGHVSDAHRRERNMFSVEVADKGPV